MKNNKKITPTNKHRRDKQRKAANASHEALLDRVDRASWESFPASDPPAWISRIPESK